jgi:hypothetical protein
VAGAGNVTMVAGLRSPAKAMELPPEPTVRAPAPDPTGEERQGDRFDYALSLTPLRLRTEFVYLAIILDAFPGEVVGWKLQSGRRLRADDET